MKRFLTVFLVISMLLSTTACAAEPEKMRSTEPQSPQISAANEEPAANAGFIDVPADADYADAVAWCSVEQLDVTFNSHTYTATLAKSNSTVEAFVQTIKDNGGAIAISAHDYGGWEKVGDLGEYLGTADNARTHTVPGDVVLYSCNQIVLFYGSNDWSYTLLGHLDGDLSNLKSDLGNGNVNITFSINQEE